MKTIFAIVVSFIVLIIVWIIVTAVMGGIGYLAAKSMKGGGLVIIIHMWFNYLLASSAASFFAIYITNQIFKSVQIKTVFASFVSIISLLSIFVVIYSFNQYINGYYELPHLIALIIQSISLLLGSYIGLKNSKQYLEVSSV